MLQGNFEERSAFLVQFVDEGTVNILGADARTGCSLEELLVGILQLVDLTIADSLLDVNERQRLLSAIGQVEVEVAVGNHIAVATEGNLVHHVEFGKDAEHGCLIPTIAVATEMVHQVFYLGAHGTCLIVVELVHHLQAAGVHLVSHAVFGGATDDTLEQSVVILYREHGEVLIFHVHQSGHRLGKASLDVGASDIV